jgi:signal transduction histidine kinase
LCSYGVNYQRVDADLLVAGVVVRDYPGSPTDARKRVLRRAKRATITRAQLEATLAQGARASADQEAEIRERKDRILAEYRESKEYEQDALTLLRPDLERTLGQVHDYKQFVQQILQNIDVLLETRFPGEAIEDKLEKAQHEEAAIYWAAQLMDEKLDVALFLLNPDRIHELRDDRPFRFHGVVTKYRKIYERQAEAKGLKFHQGGESYGSADGNARALSVIVHAFIDNAVKYAPAGSSIMLVFDEAEDVITFSVESLGPPIRDDEQERIFDLFVRGAEAAKRNADGTGFGLASARAVAIALDVEIGIDQDTQVRPGDTRKTVAYMKVRMAPERQPHGAPRGGKARRRRR